MEGRVSVHEVRGPAEAKSRVLLVFDHPAVAHGLSLLIGLEPDMEVCGEAATADEALELVADLKPDVVILDLTLRQNHGIQFISELRLAGPHARLVVFSMQYEWYSIAQALRAGADVFVAKEDGTHQIIAAIRQLLKQVPVRRGAS